MSKGIMTTEQRQKQVISRLKNENAFLRLELKKRDEEIVVLKEKLEKALLYIEELQKYVFRGKKKDDDNDSSDNILSSNTNKPVKRNRSSYRRKVPDDESITNFKEYNISKCPD